jgi:hypothetical protein
MIHTTSESEAVRSDHSVCARQMADQRTENGRDQPIGRRGCIFQAHTGMQQPWWLDSLMPLAGTLHAIERSSSSALLLRWLRSPVHVPLQQHGTGGASVGGEDGWQGRVVAKGHLASTGTANDEDEVT